MIQCPNCRFQNGDLAVLCANCGGFVQARVQTLDLFSTTWQLVESPERGMKRVILSVHKNYVVLLSSLYGIGLAFFLMWLLRLGNLFDNLQQLLFAGLLMGPPAGIFHITLVGIVGLVVSRIFAVRVRLLDLLAVAAYASMPVTVGVVFILPVEVVTFGQFLFTQNPSPLVIKPVSYIILMTLDGVTIIWSIFLMVIGIRILGDMKMVKAILISLITVVVSMFILLFLLKEVL